MQAQITPCPTFYTSKFSHKVDSTYLNATGDSIIVVDNGVRSAIPISKAFKELNQFHVDKQGVDATGTGADENPVLTITKALTLAGQADAIIVNEGTYAEAVTLATQNQTLRGQGQEYGGLTEINSLSATANGTSVRASSLTVTGTVTHSGTAPLYLSDMTVIGNYTSSSTAYTEIKDSRLQSGTISKTAAGILYITNSLIGNATFSTPNSVISLRNVNIDAGKKVTIGAGVIYSMQDVVGDVEIQAGAIPLETALLAQGATAEQAKDAQTSSFNMLAMLDPDSVATNSNVVTWNTNTKRLEITAMPKSFDTTSLSNRIDAKVDSVWYKSDTLFVKTKTGTTAYAQTKYVDSIYQNTAKDSLFWTKNGITIGYKLGGASTQDTTSWFYRLRQLNDSTVVWDRKNGTSDTVKFSFKCCEGGGSTFDTTYIYSILNKKVDTIYTNSTKDTIFYTQNGVVTKFPIGGETGTSCTNVYFDSNDPTTATIFDTANPPVVNDDALKNLSCATYFGLDGSVWTSDGTTYKTKTYSSPIHQRDVIIATANQITFTLTKTPIGGTEKVHVTRNGVDISDAWTWVGNVGTYLPAINGGKVWDAGDIARFHYEAY